MALFVDTVGEAAGTERQVVETARRLDKQKFDVHVCCLEPSAELSALNSCCNTRVFPFTRIVSSAGLTQLAAMRRYLHEHEIDIVHAFMNKTSICAVATSLGSDRIVITSRLNTGYWYTPFLKRAFRVLNLATGRVMANSNEAKRIAVEAEKLDPAMVDVLYQGVNMDVYRPGRATPRQHAVSEFRKGREWWELSRTFGRSRTSHCFSEPPNWYRKRSATQYS